jgi:prepilin-type N-terminal cleavage/methylation domain-containing protein
MWCGIGLHMKTKTDDGFTLIELLVSVLILGVIAFPLGNLTLAYFKNTTATSVRVNESYDAQLTAAYFAQDVASVGTRSTPTPPVAAPPLAQSVWTNDGGVNGCSTSGAIVLMVWDDEQTSGSTDRVAYVLTQGNTQLHRLSCTGRAGQAATVASDVKVAQDVDPLVAPTITCSSSCTGTPVPTQITLSLSIKDPADTGSTDYAITVTGQRRST